MSSQAPERLMWVAVIDFHDSHEASGEIRRCMNLGAVGIMVGGWVGERSIIDTDFEPMWVAAVNLRRNANRS